MRLSGGRIMPKAALLGLAAVLWMSASTSAVTREVRVPLTDGELRLAAIPAELRQQLHLPAWAACRASLDFSGVQGSLFVQALNAALKDGARISVTDDAFVVRFDVDKLPDDLKEAKSAARTFTSVAAPEATANQNKLYGLLLPAVMEEHRPLVVLVHGLDCDRANWSAVATLLQDEGHQVAYFTYPSDQPLSDSAELLREQMTLLREAYPDKRVDMLAHSMGGLVARAFIESPDYDGGVERLILIAPPNAGSKWAKFRLALEVEEHYHLWRHEPTWSPTWCITDGLGEAAGDLKSGSSFLRELNSRPRCPTVRYTIIAGTQHPASGLAAKWVDRSARLVPGPTRELWGFRHTYDGLKRSAEKLRTRESKSDGPVAVKSTLLEGVDDVVLLPGDHTTLYIPDQEGPPMAWATIRDRLARQ
jgi:pimeloyl-ACP methyl ester carboxylesterase